MKRIWTVCIALGILLMVGGCSKTDEPIEAPVQQTREPADSSAAVQEDVVEEPDGDSAALPNMDRLMQGLTELPEDIYVPEEITMEDVLLNAGVYRKITAEEAKVMMDRIENVAIVDVRTQEEYDAEHIEKAILVPVESIGTQEIDALPDTEQVLLVYCRSGVRSEEAAQKLLAAGYRYVYDFGGIIDWPYEVVPS